MPKLILDDVQNLQNEQSAVATINANSAATEAAFEKTLSRDGTLPNAMESQLDMNSNRIINLPEAVSGVEPLRKLEFDTLYEQLQQMNGIPGVQGPQGPIGNPGPMGPGWDAWRGQWLTATDYFVNDAVFNDGGSYICTADHTSDTATEPGVGVSWMTVWDLVAAKGTDGMGSGDVTANSNFGQDNRVIRSDGMSKGVQASGVTISDADAISGLSNVTGNASNLVTGTAGGAGELAEWNADGNVIGTNVFDWVDPTAADETSDEITCDLENGRVLFFTRTLESNEELQAPDNAPSGVTFYLLVDPVSFDLAFASGYEGSDDELPDIDSETLFAIVVVSPTRFLVHVTGQDYGDGS